MTKIETERVSKLLDFIEGIAEGDCVYGDDCIDTSRHYRCDVCQAKQVIKMDLLYLKEFIRGQ